MKPIDLAMNHGMSSPEPYDVDKPYYPTLHVESDKKIDFPHEGIMTIRFKKTSFSMSERDGEMHYSCTIEAREILDMEGEDSDERSESKKTEDALDSHAREYKNKKERY